MNTLVKSENKKVYIRFFILFIIYFILQFKFVNDGWFATDELDVMAGGMTVGKGYDVYKYFYSQHMPFSYYISAIFYLLGAKTVSLQRVYFYMFYALSWTVIWQRYKKWVDEKALIFYPIIFSCIITYYDMGTVVLSEHLAGIGFVILYLEYIKFVETRKISMDSCIAISLSIILTFGTIFVSVFGVFAIAVAVLVSECLWNKEKKWVFKDFILELVKKYYKLIVCCVLPWVFLVLYYAATHNLKNFIFQAYVINRKFYTKYNGDFDGNIIGSMLSGIDFVFSFFKSLFTVENWSYTLFAETLLLILVIAYIIKLFGKGKKNIAFVTILLLFESAPRGIFNYHATQWVEVVALLCAFAISEQFFKNKEYFNNKNMIYRVGSVLICVIILSGYFSNFSSLTSRNIEDAKDEIIEQVSSITGKKEAVWDLTLGNDYIGIGADRAIVRNVGAVPWFWEAVGLRTVEEAKSNLPRVALFNKYNECWGNRLVDYAPELVNFMSDEYTQYDNSILYIRNDYYKEACRILSNGEGYCIDNQIGQDDVPTECLKNGEIYEQQFKIDNAQIEGIKIKVGTYARINNSNICVQLLDRTCGKILTEVNISVDGFIDCDYNEICFERPVNVTAGEYSIIISAQNVSEDLSNAISFYKGTVQDEECFLINDVVQDGTLQMQVIGQFN